MVKTTDGIGGQIEGISLASFLQLLRSEGRSCRLLVSSEGRQGILSLADGEIANASLEAMEAEASIYEMLNWQGVQIRIQPREATDELSLNLPLEHILMEAARLADEQLWREQRADDDFVISGGYAALNQSLDEDNFFKENEMDNVNEVLQEAMQIDGAVGVALVALDSGMALGKAGGGNGLNLDVAAAGNTSVVNAKLKVMNDLGFRNEKIEDILISLGQQYHLIRLLGTDQSLFLYLVLNRNTANLAMARHKLAGIERKVVV
jgi:hypothetical protein